MKRYILYNKKTGEIVSSLQAYDFGSEKPREITSEELKEVGSRFFEDPKDMGSLITDEPILSSKSFAREIDLKTGKIVTKEISPEFWLKRMKERRVAKEGK